MPTAVDTAYNRFDLALAVVNQSREGIEEQVRLLVNNDFDPMSRFFFTRTTGSDAFRMRRRLFVLPECLLRKCQRCLST
jgi:hypothetical protein